MMPIFRHINFRFFDAPTYASAIVSISNDLPNTGNDGHLVQLSTDSAKLVESTPVNDICLCSCQYIEDVFAEITYTKSYKNDKTSMLFAKKKASDTIIIKLCNDALGLEEVITDNTYGSYYSTFTAQALYVGFVCDWSKVLIDLGIGKYYFKIISTILGESSTVTSISYQLSEYSDERANGSVKIESYQTGELLNSEFNYVGLVAGGWYQSIRIPGKLLEKKINLKVDNYYNLQNKLVQIQDKVEFIYEVESELIPYEIAEKLYTDILLGNSVIVSDYNVFNEAQIKEIELYYNGIEKKSFSHNPKSSYKFKFTPRFDNVIKNNY